MLCCAIPDSRENPLRTSILSTLVVGAASSVLLLTSLPAHADCVAREGELVWSWPADGATNVNPETGFAAFVYGSNFAPDAGGGLVIRVNSEIVEPVGGAGGLLRIDLEASSDYVIDFDFGDGGSETVTFTTGEAAPLSPELPPLVLESMSCQEYFGASPVFQRTECGQVLARSDCFDTGPRWLVELEYAPLILQDYTTDDIIWETEGPEGVEWFGGQALARLPGAFCVPTVTTSNIEFSGQPLLSPMCIRTRYHVPDGRTSEWSEPLCTTEPLAAPGTWPPEPGTEPGEDTGLSLPSDSDTASAADVSDDGGASDAAASAASNDGEDENVGCSSTGRAPSPWHALGLLALSAIATRRRRR
jgi:MYXO-CTERM domain-containing protein